MKILLISSYLPYPLHSGGQVRLFNLIKELSQKHEITLICEKRSHQMKEDVKVMEQFCKKVVTVLRRKQWSLKNIVRSAASSHSFLVTGHRHPTMLKKIKEELDKNSFDVIHVETFYVMENIPQTSVPIVLVEHNIEYQVYKLFANRLPLPFRTLLSIDIDKIEQNEEQAWRRATSLVAVTEEDKKEMEKKGFSPLIVTNGVNVDQFGLKDIKRSLSDTNKKILFIGDFKWIQNRDSVEFIVKDIWPLINADLKSKNKELSLKLWIVGRKIPESIRSLTDDPNVLFDEKASARPTPEIFQEASVLLCPIRVGGGSSYKILESMACGTPVVTMQMSAQSINATDKDHLLVGQTAKELAEKTVHILQDKDVYERISRKGRGLIEENYSWKMIAKELEKVYQEGVLSSDKS